MASSESRSDVGLLVGWRPVWIAPLLMLGAGVPTAQYMLHRGHFVADSVHLETAGAQVTVAGDHYTLDLPLGIYNGTQKMVQAVSFRVETYACAREGGDCQRLAAFDQAVPTNLAPGGSGDFARSLTLALPAAMAGREIRVFRKLEDITDGAPDGDDNADNSGDAPA